MIILSESNLIWIYWEIISLSNAQIYNSFGNDEIEVMRTDDQGSIDIFIFSRWIYFILFAE
jgi:hypothetical protein